MSMIRLALKLLQSQKKWMFLTLCTLVAGLTVCTTVYFSTQAIKGAILEKSYKQYGEFDAVLLDVNDSNVAVDRIQKKYPHAQIGKMGLVGSVRENEIEATVGWMDETSATLGHLKINDGRLPKKSGEIAIEEYYLHTIDPSWSLGETRTLNIGTHTDTYTLVGVVENYSSEWSTPLDVEKGVNDFPNFFISVEEFKNNENTVTVHLIVKVSESISSAENKAFELLEEYQYNGYFNENLFYVGLIDYNVISLFSMIFIMIIAVVSTLSIYQLFAFFYREQVKKSAILRACGATYYQIYKLIFVQFSFLYFVSILMSLPLTMIVSFVFIKNTFIDGSIFRDVGYGDLLIGSLIIIVVFLVQSLTAFVPLLKRKDHSILEMLKARKTNREKRILTHQSFPIQFVVNQVISRWKQTTLSILGISSVILIFFVFVFLAKETEGVWEGEEDFYYLASQKGYSYEPLAGMKLLSVDVITFDLDDVNSLEEHEGVEFVEKIPFSEDVFPILDERQQTPFLKQWSSHFIEEGQESDISHFIKDELLKGSKPLPNVNFLTVNEEEFNKITDYFFNSEEDYAKFSRENHLMIFLPSDFPEAEIQALQGEELILGKLVKDIEGEHRLEQWPYTVSNIAIGEFTLPIRETIVQHLSGITIVVDETQAFSQGIFSGYYDLKVYPKHNIDRELRLEVDTLTRNLIATIPGSLYQPILEWLQEEKKLIDFIFLTGWLLFFVTVALSSISIGTNVYSRFMEKKEEWAIYLANGMNRNVMAKCFQLELLIYFVASVVISTLAFVALVSFINRSHTVLLYLIYFGYSILLVFACLYVCSVFIIKRANKRSILSLIRKPE